MLTYLVSQSLNIQTAAKEVEVGEARRLREQEAQLLVLIHGVVLLVCVCVCVCTYVRIQYCILCPP